MLILIPAAVLRVLAANNDLWLDEVWSVAHLQGLTNWWQVFTDIHSDNNHYLNSIWLFAAPLDHPLFLRGLSVAASIGSVVLAWGLLRRSGREAQLFAAVLLGFSFLMVGDSIREGLKARAAGQEASDELAELEDDLIDVKGKIPASSSEEVAGSFVPAGVRIAT